MKFDLEKIIRPNVRNLKPYSSARDEFMGEAEVWLDANENPFGTLNRYPDPLQRELKSKIAELWGVESAQIFVGNGSDEAIDLLFRAFCEPAKDCVLCFPPTYGMYKVAAEINNVALIEIPLKDNFLPELETTKKAFAEKQPKLTFLCSPNNPTGNLMPLELVRELAQATSGLLVVDEAYIDFAEEGSTAVALLKELPNLVVLQTFSKARGLAGLRLGLAFSSPEISQVLNKIKPPYNVNSLSQNMALRALRETVRYQQEIQLLVRQRDWLAEELRQLPKVKEIFPSQANFLLVHFAEARKTYEYLLEKGIVVRDRSSHVAGCLRLTIGRPEENKRLLEALKSL